ncbi:glycosyltransferase family 4 protein [Effusibacillus consociatus]|uniref:Glycosyltransferase family 4 protein n=1 Tax=Effusibacillus consociatus TaxID=1117041 RepID=A0ABV9PZI2_9BACL
MNIQKVMLVSHHAHPQIVTGAEKALLMFGSACQSVHLEVLWISPTPGLSYERAIQMGMDTRLVSFPFLWNLIYNPNELVEELSIFQQAADDSELNEVIATYSPDLIVSNSAINGMPALIARKRKIPVWWYIHEVIPKLDGIDRFLSMIHSHSDRVLVPSMTVAQSISQGNNTASSVQLLPYGVEIPSYPSLIGNRQKVRNQNGWTYNHVVIGWFGSVYQGKGLLELIRACSFLKNQEKTIILLAAGNIGDPGYFNVCQEEAKLLESVEFRYLGALPHIEEVLASVDMVVVPSIVEEAFPNVALEAMSFGKPVVAFESGGLKEIVVNGETGLLAGTGDIVLLSSYIQDLVHESAKRVRMGTKGRKRAVNLFRKEIFQRRVQKIIQQK